jgi:hypothetical protein
VAVPAGLATVGVSLAWLLPVLLVVPAKTVPLCTGRGAAAGTAGRDGTDCLPGRPVLVLGAILMARTARIISLEVASNLGLQVVKVSMALRVGVNTDTSVGGTTCWYSTRYTQVVPEVSVR